MDYTGFVVAYLGEPVKKLALLRDLKAWFVDANPQPWGFARYAILRVSFDGILMPAGFTIITHMSESF